MPPVPGSASWQLHDLPLPFSPCCQPGETPRLYSLTRLLPLWLLVRLRQQGGRVRAQQKTEGKEDSAAGIALPLAAFSQICSNRLHPWVKAVAPLSDPPHLTVSLQVSTMHPFLAPSGLGRGWESSQ